MFQELCVALDNFDKRTIELLLTRASNSRPPAHLSDLGTVDLMETYGRERRHRYFTRAAYKCVMASEQLQDTTTSVIDVDLSRVGEFSVLDPKHFYTTTGMLHSYQDSFKGITTAKGKKRKRDEGPSDEECEPLPKPKRGRPRKTSRFTDTSTITPKKRGRPRKDTFVRDSELEGIGGVQPRALTHRSSKRARAFALDVDQDSITRPKDDDTTGSGGRQLLEVSESNPLVSVFQEEGSLAILTVSAFHMSSWPDANSNSN